jgi:hypothetical protein
MVDRHLNGLAARGVVGSGNVEPADEGPEGPPRHTAGAVPAGR